MFFLYCLLALTAVGTSISHAWHTHKALSREKKLLTSAS